MNTLRNEVQLIGNLGRDVEFKELSNGSHLAKFTMATNEFYKNKKGEKVQETTWHNIVAWGKLAELMNVHLEKGIEVAIKGKIVNANYEDKNGNTVYRTEIKASDFIKMDKKEPMPF